MLNKIDFPVLLPCQAEPASAAPAAGSGSGRGAAAPLAGPSAAQDTQAADDHWTSGAAGFTVTCIVLQLDSELQVDSEAQARVPSQPQAYFGRGCHGSPGLAARWWPGGAGSDLGQGHGQAWLQGPLFRIRFFRFLAPPGGVGPEY